MPSLNIRQIPLQRRIGDASAPPHLYFVREHPTNVLPHILDRLKSRVYNPGYGIRIDYVKQSHRRASARVLENLNGKRRRAAAGIDLMRGILNAEIWLLSLSQNVCLVGQMVQLSAVVVVAFESVAVRNPRRLIDRHSPRSLTTLPLAILLIHQLLIEVALVEVKVDAVHCDQFSQ